MKNTITVLMVLLCGVALGIAAGRWPSNTEQAASPARSLSDFTFITG